MQASAFEAMTRVGFAARGLMYMMTGALALRLGLITDKDAALLVLRSHGGMLLLAGMAAGFLAYGTWRLAEAVVDTQGYGTKPKGLGKRIVGAGSGLIHLSLALYCARLALEGRQARHRSDDVQNGADMAMALPGGSLWLWIGAAVLLGAGLTQGRKAIKASFLKHLNAGAQDKPWVRLTGSLGYATRGVVFVTVAWAFYKAARAESAAPAAGPAEALRLLPETLQMLVAVGLILFGLFSLVEAWYRRITDPHVLDRLNRTVQTAVR